jgi:hypothetical protein
MLVTLRWPRGTGQWNRTKVVIVSSEETSRDRLVRIWVEQFDVALARTPLELIAHLETEGLGISTVVISDVVGSTGGHELGEFLDAYYPWLRVIAIEKPSSAVTPDDVVSYA